jgi:hypothetical protein
MSSLREVCTKKKCKRIIYEAFGAKKNKKLSWVISTVKVELKTSVLDNYSVSMIMINVGNELRPITQSI